MKETFYFKHDYNAHNDPKIEMLLYKEGWEGYGLYWALIEKLSQETGRWKLECDYDALSFVLRTKYERIQNVIEAYELFTVEDGVFYSNRLLSQMMEREEKRAKARSSIEKRWAKQKEKNTNVYTNVIAGKERKGKERKVNNNNFDVFYSSYPVKKSKQAAEKAFNKVKVDVQVLLDALEKQKKERELLKKSNQFCPEWKHPSTWLNQGCWEDESKELTIEEEYKIMSFDKFKDKHGEGVAMKFLLN